VINVFKQQIEETGVNVVFVQLCQKKQGLERARAWGVKGRRSSELTLRFVVTFWRGMSCETKKVFVSCVGVVTLVEGRE